MPYPSPPTFIAFLDANPTRYKDTPEVDGYNSTQDILDEITKRELIPNPEPQGDVPKPLKNSDLAALISSESAGRLSDTWWYAMQINLSGGSDPATGLIGSREDAVAQVDSAEDRNNIQADEATAMRDEINSTIPDPDWPAEVQDDADCYKEWELGGMSSSFVNNSLGRV